ncbi:Cathepsin_L [Hexamita inflata]|uniref:Cathepsin_L n=1 Tax=Hexamita inflata TaxID=28002 RepID=A0ABP1IK65_9EUKA
MLLTIIHCTRLDLTKLSCEEGFVFYKQNFNKTYQQDEKMHFDIFCSNFLIVVELLETNPYLPIGLVPMMDCNVDNHVEQQTGGLYKMKVAKNDYCSTVNPLPNLVTDKIYPSIDLREMRLVTPTKAQGNSGCCYAFQTMAIMENGILRDKKNLNAFWQAKADASTLNLSEQYLLSNSFCDTCRYCGGGNFVIQTYIMVPGNKQQLTPPRNPIPTIELNDNYPFDYVTYQANWTAGIYLPTKLSVENQLLPIKLFSNSGLYAAWCNQGAKVTPVVKIFDDDASTFNATTIATLKSYLSRGIAVAISMLVGSGDPKIIFQNYNGGSILHNPCPTWAMDHAVTLVGYGKKNGKFVWVIKNSFGEQWGDQGFFFLEIGKNSYCSEQFAYTSIPKYFDMTETTPYARGTLNRGLTYTLDCDNYFTNISGTIDCCDTCPSAYPILLTSKQCLDKCPDMIPYYETGSCVTRCFTGAYQLSGSVLNCVASCSGMYVTNISNLNSKQCIAQCPDATPYYETGACVSRCTSGAYSIVLATVNVLTCQASCALYVLNSSNQDSKQCLPSCPTTAPYSDSGLCSARCASGNYSNATGSFVCQGACPKFFVTNASNSNSKQCVDACQAGQLVSGQECLSSCPAATPYKDATSCVARCSSGSYQISGSNFNCVASCSGMYITNVSNSNSQQCITVCPALIPYYETGACVSRCTSGAYSVVTGPQTLMCQTSCTFYVLNASNSNSKQCLPSCPAATPYSDAGLCSARCASGNYSNSAGSLICQGACAKFFVTNASNSNSKQCVDSCQAGQVTSAQECLSSCPSAAPFNDSTACVARCSSGAYLAAGSNLTCVSSCTEIYIKNASNSNSKQCLSSCPDATPYYETGACVVKCSTGAYQVVTGQAQTLVCQASCTFFVLNASNSNSKQCVDACAQGQVSNGQECLGGCPSSAPYKDGLVCYDVCPSKAYEKSGADFLCVSSCTGLFIINQSSQNSKQCTICPSTTPYYETGTCVENCAFNAYSIITGQAQTLVCEVSCTYFILNSDNSKQCLKSCPTYHGRWTFQECGPNGC